MLVGLFSIVPRGGGSGSTAMRVLGFGLQGLHETPGDSAQASVKRPWSRQVMGAAAIIAGILIIHFATN